MALAISHTTRPQRPGEIDKSDYFFVDLKDFEGLKNKEEFLEYTNYNNNFYGTSFSEIERIMSENKYPLLDLDLNGVLSGFNAFGKENYFGVWIDVPDQKILKHRLTYR
jgi:guanylate kinase